MAPEVTDWLADPKRARWHLHFTPTSSSWLNLVERWFASSPNAASAEACFTSVCDLVDAITSWATCWNNDPKFFIWHKAADEIIENVRRGRAALHQIKSATDH